MTSAKPYKTLQSGTFYLNRKSPLWVLNDEQRKDAAVPLKSPPKEKLKYDHIKPIYVRRQNSRRSSYSPPNRHFPYKAQKRVTLYTRPNLHLPRNYLPHNRQRIPEFKPMPQLPKFDSIPGQESFDRPVPLFVYTGNKGRMLFNTMMSRYKYPMQEPVPGQTLHPPKTMMVKNKSRKESQFTSPFTPQPPVLNVSMIPFYAFEAINPTTTTTARPPLTPQYPSTKSYKKSKKYTAFFAPQDILSQHSFDTTTSLPLTLEKPFANHRHYLEESPTSTTSLPHKKLEVTYNDGEDKFRITYEDENADVNLERPTEFTTVEPTPKYQP
ncbi:uncharacterized protein LOC133336030, partial [Musca vetustissima]|uniref:uncharacterized protein LOC133336030 n=1 Tax=Musca vetustissima TaxID=27455 RepID=UPI002AB6D4AF